MRKIDKYEFWLMAYFGCCILGYIIFYLHLGSPAFVKGFMLIREHLFIIGLLLLLRLVVSSVLGNLFLWGIIAYKIELILYNIALLIVPEKYYNQLNTSYDVLIILILSIFIIVFVCTFFDKIVITINKLYSLIFKAFKNDRI